MPRLAVPKPKKSDRHDSVEVVFRAFLATSGALRGKMRDYFTRFGISGVQWGVMRVRSDGATLKSFATGPSPFAFVPWQEAQ